MFGTKERDAAQERRESEEAQALIEQLALAQVPEIEAKQPALLERFHAQHAADVASYSFDCKRHGDHLTLFMSRRGKDYATTLNLGANRSITLNEGHTPDREGTQGFSATLSRKGQDSCGSYSFSGGHPEPARKAPDGYEWRVRHHGEPYGPRGEMVELADREADYGLSWFGGPIIQTVVGNTARPAEDDVIWFAGINARVYAPAGLGKAVEAKILKAIASVKLFPRPLDR